MLGCVETPPSAESLAGTSWRLVAFQGSDGMVLRPDDRSRYAFSFGADGTVAAHIDCNRGHWSWKSEGRGRLEFGPMAITRAVCPPGSMHDQLVRQLPHVRSYIMRGGRLYLVLKADGGTYELEPLH